MKMTINLEQELIKSNKNLKLYTSSEILHIQESEKLDKVPNSSEILSKIGINSHLKEVNDLKNIIESNKKSTLKFDQSRVFHIDQIEEICNKYRLRFLKSELYQGSIDENLPIKISTFELAHQIQMNKTNTFIMAPKESFKLQPVPDDPLMFYKINEDWFYLVHKWGNDLNISRRFLSILESGWLFFISHLIFFLGISLWICFKPEVPNDGKLGMIFVAILCACGVWFINLMFHDMVGFISENNWNSKFED